MVNRTTSRPNKSNGSAKTSLTPKRAFSRPLLLIFAAVILFIGYQISLLFYSYASDVAIPVEKALAEVGAVKGCSEQSAGRGPDNSMPWYVAYYEVPGNIDQATEKIHNAFEKAGLRLADGPNPPNPQGNRFFSDVGRKSPYGDLKDGNIRYLVSIYEANDYQFCGRIVAVGNTAFSLTVNLPEFKR